jgi:hypothetical protein
MGLPVGSIAGSSRGSTRIVRSGSPIFMLAPHGSRLRNGRTASHRRVFRGSFPSEYSFTDKTLAHALIDKEHFASPVGLGHRFAALTFAVPDVLLREAHLPTVMLHTDWRNRLEIGLGYQESLVTVTGFPVSFPVCSVR